MNRRSFITRSLPTTLFLASNLSTYMNANDFHETLLLGDLLFYKTSDKNRHVGIYIGEGKFFHAGNSTGVTKSRVKSWYWRNKLFHIRRPPTTFTKEDLESHYHAHKGKPWAWGKEGPDQFDCSGLVWKVFTDLGRKEVPRSTELLLKYGQEVLLT